MEMTNEAISNNYLMKMKRIQLKIDNKFDSGRIICGISRDNQIILNGTNMDLSDELKLEKYLMENEGNVNIYELIFATLKKIEEIRGRPIVSYYGYTPNMNTSPKINGSISESDIDVFYDLLNSEKFQDVNEIDFVLNTTGGYINTAKQIMDILHDRFRIVNVIVPRMAASAGTLMCTGAKEIIVLEKTKLTMTDPHIGGVSTYNLRRFNFLLHLYRLCTEKEYRDIYNISPTYQANNADKHAKKILDLFLNKHIDSNSSENYFVKHLKVRKISKALLTYTNFYSHEYPLSLKELKKIGLNIVFAKSEFKQLLEQFDLLNRKVFELNNCAKFFTNNEKWISKGGE